MKNFVIKTFLIALICLLLGYLTRHYRIEIVESGQEVKQSAFRKVHFVTNKTAEVKETTVDSSTTTTTTTTTTSINTVFELDYILLNIDDSKSAENHDLLREFDDRKALLRRVCYLQKNIETEFANIDENSTTSLIYALDNAQRIINSGEDPDSSKCKQSPTRRNHIYSSANDKFTACLPPETGSAFWLRNYHQSLEKIDVSDEVDLKSAVNDYVTFMTVRNPFDRLLMIYRKG